jgi:beta-D-xylosidase 4
MGDAIGGHQYRPSYAEAIGAAFEAGSDNLCWARSGTMPDPGRAFS